MLIYCRVITEIFFWGGGTDIFSTWSVGRGNSDVEKDTTRHHSEKIPVASKGDSVTRAIKSPTKAFPDFDAWRRVVSRSVACVVCSLTLKSIGSFLGRR